MHFGQRKRFSKEVLMKLTSLILIVSISFIGLSIGCAPKTLPPELKVAYTANQVLTRVGELQATVIGLYDANPRAITQENAVLVVHFTVTAATIIQSSMDGWQPTVKTAWAELKSKYTPTDPKLEVIWNLTDVMVQSLNGVQ